MSEFFLLHTKIILFFYRMIQKISGLLKNFRIAMLSCYRGFSLSELLCLPYVGFFSCFRIHNYQLTDFNRLYDNLFLFENIYQSFFCLLKVKGKELWYLWIYSLTGVFREHTLFFFSSFPMDGLRCLLYLKLVQVT